LALEFVTECGTNLRAWTLHVVALSCPWQQDIRRQAAVLSDTPILQSCRCTPKFSDSDAWPKRYGLGRILPTTFIAHWQAEGGNNDST